MTPLAKLIKDNGTRQVFLAELLGVSEERIRTLKLGISKMRGDEIVKLAAFYHVSATELLPPSDPSIRKTSAKPLRDHE